MSQTSGTAGNGPVGVPPPPSGSTPDPNFFRRLFDIRFHHFITPSIATVLYVISIGLISLVSIVLFAQAADQEQLGVALIGVPIFWFLGILYARVLIELVMVLFRIERNTRK